MLMIHKNTINWVIHYASGHLGGESCIPYTQSITNGSKGLKMGGRGRLENETTSPKEKCLNDIKRKLEWFTHKMFNPTGKVKSMRYCILCPSNEQKKWIF